jgi:hypothetical protein
LPGLRFIAANGLRQFATYGLSHAASHLHMLKAYALHVLLQPLCCLQDIVLVLRQR